MNVTKTGPIVFIGFWLFAVLINLGFLGLVAWAIYRLVIHFTS